MRESSKGSGAALQPVQMPGEAAWTTGLLCYHLTIKVCLLRQEVHLAVGS